MKITFNHNHLNHAAGDTIETTEGEGKYLVAVNAAKEAGETDHHKKEEHNRVYHKKK